MAPTRTILLALLLTMPLACTSASTRRAPQSADETSAAKAERGPTDAAALLFRATRTLPLDVDRRSTIGALDDELAISRAHVSAAFEDLKAVLVAGIRGGRIDRARIANDEDAIEETMQVHVNETIHALDSLHALLVGAQRIAVVEAARSNLEPVGGGPPSTEGIEVRNRHKLDELVSALRLDAGQRDRVWALVDKTPSAMESPYETRRQRAEALFAAFEAPTFDARTVVTAPGETNVRERVDERVSFVCDLVPMLRPDQREKLAALVEDRWTRR